MANGGLTPEQQKAIDQNEGLLKTILPRGGAGVGVDRGADIINKPPVSMEGMGAYEYSNPTDPQAGEGIPNPIDLLGSIARGIRKASSPSPSAQKEDFVAKAATAAAADKTSLADLQSSFLTPAQPGGGVGIPKDATAGNDLNYVNKEQPASPFYDSSTKGGITTLTPKEQQPRDIQGQIEDLVNTLSPSDDAYSRTAKVGKIKALSGIMAQNVEMEKAKLGLEGHKITASEANDLRRQHLDQLRVQNEGLREDKKSSREDTGALKSLQMYERKLSLHGTKRKNAETGQEVNDYRPYLLDQMLDSPNAIHEEYSDEAKVLKQSHDDYVARALKGNPKIKDTPEIRAALRKKFKAEHL